MVVQVLAKALGCGKVVVHGDVGNGGGVVHIDKIHDRGPSLCRDRVGSGNVGGGGGLDVNVHVVDGVIGSRPGRGGGQHTLTTQRCSAG